MRSGKKNFPWHSLWQQPEYLLVGNSRGCAGEYFLWKLVLKPVRLLVPWGKRLCLGHSGNTEKPILVDTAHLLMITNNPGVRFTGQRKKSSKNVMLILMYKTRKILSYLIIIHFFILEPHPFIHASCSINIMSARHYFRQMIISLTRQMIDTHISWQPRLSKIVTRLLPLCQDFQPLWAWSVLTTCSVWALFSSQKW